MPKDHRRKKYLAALKNELGIGHACAVRLLDHPDAYERELMAGYLAEYIDITCFDQALEYLRQEQNNPLNQLLCETCGWTNRMVCPECSGCGCDDYCSGWRHTEFAEGDPDHDTRGCPECGAGSGGNPYGECCCYDYDDEAEDEAA